MGLNRETIRRQKHSQWQVPEKKEIDFPTDFWSLSSELTAAPPQQPQLLPSAVTQASASTCSSHSRVARVSVGILTAVLPAAVSAVLPAFPSARALPWVSSSLLYLRTATLVPNLDKAVQQVQKLQEKTEA